MIKQKLFENFANPQGLFGRLAGQIMARKSSNTERSVWAVTELDPLPDAHVLEVGYGPGVAISEMSRRVAHGTVAGVDVSEVMLAQASRRNKEGISEGRVDLRVGDAQNLDTEVGPFDLIYGINVWQFWADQDATIAALRNRLSADGRLALVYMQPPTSDTASDAAAAALQEQYAAAGFDEVEVRTMDHDPPAVMVVGYR
jgi:ubiquinone/menaquinone biosynthesis C-methylase UbiE